MTDNIKLPPVPESIFYSSGELWTLIDKWYRADPGLHASVAANTINDAITRLMNKHAIEAVRLNAQTDIRTLIANDAYAMTFQSLGQYRSALLAALSAAPAAPQPAQAVPDGWVLVPVEPTPEMIDAANLARKYREHGALTDPDVLNSRTYNSRQTYAAMLSAAPAPPQPAQPLTDEQCDAIYMALDNWAREFDEYEFGLPHSCGGGVEGGREIIRQAHGIGVKND